MGESRKIRRPFAQYVQEMRYRLLPAVVFAGLVVLAGWLWGRQMGMPELVGEAEIVRAELAAPQDGVLVAPRNGWPDPLESVEAGQFEVHVLNDADNGWPDLFESVEAGQTIARIDDRPLMARLAAMRNQLGQRREEVDAAKAQLRQEQAAMDLDRYAELRRLLIDIERLRLEVLDRRAFIQARQVEAQRLEEQIARIGRAVERDAETLWTLRNFEYQLEQIRAELEGNREALQTAEQQLEEARRRLQDSPEPVPAEWQAVLAPLRSAIAVQEALVEELQLQAEQLRILAPISGQIAAIHRLPGQAVRAGDIVFVVASDQSQRVVSYIRETHRGQPRRGMEVTVRTRGPEPTAQPGTIKHVGPQVEQVPLHQLKSPDAVEWGTPVTISIDEGPPLTPGQLVDIILKR